jgi:cold shock CspA family protein
MLAERYYFNEQSNAQKSLGLAPSEDSFSSEQYFSEMMPNRQNNEFQNQLYPNNVCDFHSLATPPMDTFPIYSDKNKGVRSMPPSPLIFPKINPALQMNHPVEMGTNSSMQGHPGFAQMSKPFGMRPQYENVFVKQPYQRSPELNSSVAPHMPGTTSSISSKRLTGRLKFFDETQNYGFFVLDIDNSDLFVHFEDLRKAGLNKEFLKAIRENSAIKFSFNCVTYYGKYSLSKKAINIEYFC